MSEIDRNEHWSELYRKALFAEDREQLPLLLEQAHHAVQQRVLELWYSPAELQKTTENERRELDAAAYYLALLKTIELGKPITNT